MATTTPHAAREGDKSNRDTSDRYDALRKDVASLADTVKSMSREELGAMVGNAQDKAVKQLDSLEATVRRSPTQAAMIAAGVGFLVGLMLVR